MKKERIFQLALGWAEEITGLPKEAILRGRDEDASDARYVLVLHLSRLLTDADLAALLFRTRQGVGHIRRNTKKRGRWTVERNLKEMGKKMESIGLQEE
jgi:hypothetical protein